MTYTYLRNPKAMFAWLSITLGLLMWIGTSIILTLQGWNQPAITARDTTELVKMIFGLVALMAIFLGPFLTSHELRQNTLVIRQGLNFTGVIPYGNIASVQQTDRKPIAGLGIRPYPHILFVVIWPDRLVSIKLKDPQRFRLLQVLPLWKFDEIIVNVDEPGQFAAAVRQRTSPK